MNLKINKYLTLPFLVLFYCESLAQSPLDYGFVMFDLQKSNLIVALPPTNVNPSQYIFYKKADDSDIYTELINSKSKGFVDTNVDVNARAYCYKIQYVDESGQKSAMSPPLCSIWLKSDEVGMLNWTAAGELLAAQPIEYYVDLFNPDGSIVQTVKATGTSLRYDNVPLISEALDLYGKAMLRIRIIQPIPYDFNGANIYPLTTYSNNFTVYPVPKLFIPNAFTPNGSGDLSTETFMVQGKFIENFTMQIYNKWGSIIFESNEMKMGWNGTSADNSPCPSGEYIYHIIAKGNSGQSFEQIGSLMLIR